MFLESPFIFLNIISMFFILFFPYTNLVFMVLSKESVSLKLDFVLFILRLKRYVIVDVVQRI